MANDNFEKRMEFLKKSYERVPTSFDPDEVFRKIDEEGKSQPHEQNKSAKNSMKQRITVWAMSVASILIIGLIGTGYIFDQKQKSEKEIFQFPVTDEYIESLFDRYEEERDKRREILKLDEVFFKHYASYADSTMNLLKNESYLEMVREGTEKTPLEETYNRAVEELKLPSEMLKDLKGNSFEKDEQGSIRFLGDYRRKVQMLIEIYDQIIIESKEAIDAYEVDPNVDKAEIMLLSSKGFPEQLQNIIGTMRDQLIKLYTEKYSGQIRTRYYNFNIHEDLHSRLHHNTSAYILMIAEEPYMYGPILQYPLDEIAYKLGIMERTLMDVEKDSTLYPVLESYYLAIFNELVKGSENTKIFDEDGVLLPEYQDVWRGLAVNGDATPLAYVMQPIVKEMEASGWRKSKSWDSLTYDALKDAIVLSREGQLEYYMYGERPDFKSETINFPNESFWNEVQELYADFKKTYDKSVLKGASPIYVLAIFDYANEMNDPQTMYYLYNVNRLNDETGIDYTVDYYVENWRKGLSFFRNATEVEFDKELVHRSGLQFYSSVVFTRLDREVQMIYNEDGIWEVGAYGMEVLPSYRESSERDFQEELMSGGQYNYKGFIKTKDQKELSWREPWEIVGMYFYAGKIGDFETQYELFYHGEDSDAVDKETFLKNPEKYFLPYDDKMYKKVSFQGMEQDENGNWPGIATLTVDTKMFPDLPSERQFHMYWTEDGWRVKFNPLE
jgi:hypothetical protein